MIYGLSNESGAYQRTFKNGMLNSTYRHGQHWLPTTTNSSNDCPTYRDAKICYQAGENFTGFIISTTSFTMLSIIKRIDRRNDSSWIT